jgi:hypothetical protein
MSERGTTRMSFVQPCVFPYPYGGTCNKLQVHFRCTAELGVDLLRRPLKNPIAKVARRSDSNPWCVLWDICLALFIRRGNARLDGPSEMILERQLHQGNTFLRLMICQYVQIVLTLVRYFRLDLLTHTEHERDMPSTAPAK